MITINEQILKELILKTEPGFLLQRDLEINHFGRANQFGGEYVWVWDKARIRNLDQINLHDIVLKIVEA